MKRKFISTLLVASVITSNFVVIDGKVVLAAEKSEINNKIEQELNNDGINEDVKSEEKLSNDSEIEEKKEEELSKDKIEESFHPIIEDENTKEDIDINDPNYCAAGHIHDEKRPTNFSVKSNTPVINGLKVNKQLIDINYSKGVTIQPKYIVIHDTDNRKKGATAMANRNYFANHPNANASAHYIVDEGNIVQALEDTWKGWHVGDGGSGAKINNGNTIAIEMCVNQGNNFDKTMEHTIELTKYLMKKHNISADNIVMHNDASGKICSRMMIQDRPNLWPHFKKAVASESQLPIPGEDEAINTGEVYNISSYLNVRKEPSTSSAAVGRLSNGTKVDILEERGKWYKVRANVNGNKVTGFASADYIRITGGQTQPPKPEPPVNPEEIFKVKHSIIGKSEVTKEGFKAYLRDHSKKYNVSYKLTVSMEQFVDLAYKEAEIEGVRGDMVVAQAIWETGYFQYGGIVAPEDNNFAGIGATGNGNEREKFPSAQIGLRAQVQHLKAYASKDPLKQDCVDPRYHLVNKGSAPSLEELAGKWAVPGYDTSKYGSLAEAAKNNATYGQKIYGVMEKAMSFNGQEPVEPTPPPVTPDPPSGDKKYGVVNVDSALNVRSGPGTNYSVIGSLGNNKKVQILGESGDWYKILFNGRDGYVSKQFVKVEGSGEETKPEPPVTPPVEKKYGVVNVKTSLNVRSGAGTNHSVIATLPRDKKVEIVGESGDWYKISFDGKQGYASKQYINLETSGGGQTPEPPVTPPSDKKYGIVNVNDSLNVRSGAGTNHSVIASLPKNKKVEIIGESGNWFKINFDGREGFVSKDYIIVEGQSSGGGSTNREGIVQVSSALNVRSGAGTNHSVIGSLRKGQSVTITGESGDWYKINFNGQSGYVAKQYIKVASRMVSRAVSKGEVVGVNSNLTVRSAASDTSRPTAYLMLGDTFDIKDEKDDWYLIQNGDKSGYVSKEYVQEFKGEKVKTTAPTLSNGQIATTNNVEGNLSIINSEGKAIGYIFEGETFEILDTTGNWYQIKYKDKKGFVNSKFVKEAK
ncbi:MAG: SH3 domain-containing protein [Clostridium sp.]